MDDNFSSCPRAQVVTVSTLPHYISRVSRQHHFPPPRRENVNEVYTQRRQHTRTQQTAATQRADSWNHNHKPTNLRRSTAGLPGPVVPCPVTLHNRVALYSAPYPRGLEHGARGSALRTLSVVPPRGAAAAVALRWGGRHLDGREGARAAVAAGEHRLADRLRHLPSKEGGGEECRGGGANAQMCVSACVGVASPASIAFGSLNTCARPQGSALTAHPRASVVRRARRTSQRNPPEKLACA